MFKILGFLSKRSDVALMALLLVIVFMIIVPLPTWLIDLFIVINIGLVLLTLSLIITLQNPATFSTFPSILLFATLLRLAISISTTRMILVQADAGQIVEAFGFFVVGGNMIIGIVIFLIITVVQFIVITKGAERVAEVSARFALDSLPGKQMAIDADMRAGEIDIKEAKKRREMVRLESDFYGSMDGAMKFVKGDTIAGIIIILVNLIGGIAVGMGQNGLDFGTAAEIYSVLTVGDGLVAQIPALIMAVAAGIVITRISRENEDQKTENDLGREIMTQLQGSGAPLYIAAASLTLFAFIPGFPTVTFLIIAGIFAAINVLIKTQNKRNRDDLQEAQQAGDLELTHLASVKLEISEGLCEGLDLELLGTHLASVRRELYDHFGVPFPSTSLEVGTETGGKNWTVFIEGVPAVSGFIPENSIQALEDEETLNRAGIEFIVTQEGSHPVRWTPVDRVPDFEREALNWGSTEDYLKSVLLDALPKNVSEFLGIEETSALLDSLGERHGALVDAAKKASNVEAIAKILRRLVSEKVAVKNFRLILEAIIQWAPKEEDPDLLAEHVRTALARQISYRFSNDDGMIACYLFDPGIQNVLRESVRFNQVGSFFALASDQAVALIDAVKETIGSVDSHEDEVVVIVSPDLRAPLHQFFSLHQLNFPVLSQKEVADNVQIYPLATINIPELM